MNQTHYQMLKSIYLYEQYILPADNISREPRNSLFFSLQEQAKPYLTSSPTSLSASLSLSMILFYLKQKIYPLRLSFQKSYSLFALLSSLLSVSHPPQEKSAHLSGVLCTFTVRMFDITFVLDNNPHPIRSTDEDCCHVDALYLLSLSSTSPFTPWLRMLSQQNFESGCSCH